MEFFNQSDWICILSFISSSNVSIFLFGTKELEFEKDEKVKTLKQWMVVFETNKHSKTRKMEQKIKQFLYDNTKDIEWNSIKIFNFNDFKSSNMNNERFISFMIWNIGSNKDKFSIKDMHKWKKSKNIKEFEEFEKFDKFRDQIN